MSDEDLAHGDIFDKWDTHNPEHNAKIAYHARYLAEKDLILAVASKKHTCIPLRLTAKGHDYIEDMIKRGAPTDHREDAALVKHTK